MKYTWTETPHVRARLIAPGGHLDGIVLRQHAFVLGDPEVSALVVEGTRRQLGLFADELHAVLLQDPHEALALAAAERVGYCNKGRFGPSVDGSHLLVDQVARDVSLAVVAELKGAGYLTPPDPGVT